MHTYICRCCGSYLDPGEKCDCEKRKTKGADEGAEETQKNREAQSEDKSR